MRLQSSLQSFSVAVALVCVCCSGFNLSPDRVLASAVAPRPTIAQVSREKKTLVVIGQNFVFGAKILINGNAQKTIYESATRLISKKAGKRIQEHDILQVQNPDGSVSSDFRYVLEPYSVSVDAVDIVYARTRDRVYASVGGSGAYADSIAVINPRTAEVESSTPIGRQPGLLALSGDEHYLYAVLLEGAVARLDLTTGRRDLTFPINIKGHSADLRVTDIRVIPDSPSSVVISAGFKEYTGHAGVAVFDNGVARPVVSPTTANPTKICFGATPDVLWGYNQDDDSFDLWRLRVEQDGVHVIDNYGRGLLYGFNRSFVFNDGLLYTGDGRAINPEKRTYDGRFYDWYVLYASTVTIAAEEQRAFVGVREGYRLILASFDMATYQLTSYYSGSTFGVGDTPTRLAWCGPSGLAVIGNTLDHTNVVFFPRGFFKPLPAYERPQPVPLNNEVRRIPLLNNGLLYDNARRVLYATTPGIAGEIGNSVVKIDPFNAAITDVQWVGSEPWQMTLSDGGRYLYVALQGGTAIQRVSLPDLARDLRFPLSSSSSAVFGPTPTEAAQMLPVPGRPESVIVARAQAPGSGTPLADGVGVYDNGVPRPVLTPGWSWGNDEGPVNVIQQSSSSGTLYGIDNEISDFKFFKLSVGDDGVRVVSRVWNIGNGFGIDMKCEGVQCFTNSGLIIDPEAMTRRAYIQIGYDSSNDFIFSTSVVPDTRRGRVFYLIERQSGVYVDAYDITTLKKVASYKIPNLNKSVFDFLIWNDDQFAFSTLDEVVLVPMSLLQPVH
jgi:hypothetical protein